MKANETIIQRIVELSQKKYPDAEVYLYGSRARGDAKKLSDWDLLILLKSKELPFALETQIMDEFYEIELEVGEVISPLIYTKDEWYNKYKLSALFHNIKNESIRIA